MTTHEWHRLFGKYVKKYLDRRQVQSSYQVFPVQQNLQLGMGTERVTRKSMTQLRRTVTVTQR